MEGSMIDAKMAPYGALLLRVSMGILFLLHGVYLKAFAFGMTGTAKFFAGLGLAEWFAWLVMLYETIGGLALIFGVYARWVALFLGIDRKSTRLNSSHGYISYAVFCLKKKICSRISPYWLAPNWAWQSSQVSVPTTTLWWYPQLSHRFAVSVMCPEPVESAVLRGSCMH